ncbi:uncharacterized protein NECHADRAFT_78691 [Fusarium vanettenii 77-13-4]|uniref:N-acetyltransferase domain-containing protein n=1 Tax=Fusarium vanettenii (strain ATCC MYA-4622 / CBS 123669 / FGSC 9596 / NRRL 45880 / 77-13-4) TaxID=660122 RepID=C7YPA5_FUSV7|nr:uncharacterized protein NECHADRAFT_78691 [Fusarium vanettenii 77-13-4]EEU45810.1 hypothetical protein NECHADRAFT_78691 [Fusarium vanettenii 77-13-4]
MASITIRPATKEDLPSMLSVYFSAFSTSLFSQRCFPSTSPDVQAWIANSLRSQIEGTRGNRVVIAESEPGSVLGWARWVRRPAAPSKRAILSESDYPSSGDPALAVRLFEANANATYKHAAGEEYWFLSTIATAKEAQRRGVGSALMQFGVDKADEEGWMAYLNSSPEGKGLYEKFGFEVVDESEIPELNIVQYHMKRAAKPSS